MGESTSHSPITVELIEHAQRCWQAEVENSERLSRKSRSLFTVVVALAGLGLFRIEWAMGAEQASRVSPDYMVYFVKFLISLALILIGWALLRTRPDHIEQAVGWLRTLKRAGTIFALFCGVVW